MARKETDNGPVVHGKFLSHFRRTEVLAWSQFGRNHWSWDCVFPKRQPSHKFFMARSISPPGDQATTLRNLKVLVVLLVVSNILVGVLGVYLLRLVDRRYSELITLTVPVLNDLQTLTAKSVATMRSTNPIFFDNLGAQLESAIQRGQAQFDAERNLRAKLLAAQWLPASSAKRTEFQQAGDAFTRLGGEVLARYAAGQMAAASRLREETLRPAFERYQAAVTDISDVLFAESKLTSDDFTARTSHLTTIVLGVASWPVIVLIGLLMVTVAFVVAMMIAFRGKDLADTP
jgi:hypothetical protein